MRTRVRAESANQRRSGGSGAQGMSDRVANVAHLLGVSGEQAKEVVAKHDAMAAKKKEAKRKAAVEDAVEAAAAIAMKEVEAQVRDVCLLAFCADGLCIVSVEVRCFDVAPRVWCTRRILWAVDESGRWTV